MSWYLATDANIRQLPVYEQLFAFSYSYLGAAQVLCHQAVERTHERDWPGGAVILMNSAHAVELFLKAALLRRENNLDVWSHGHNIHTLAIEYGRLFPEPELAWDVPFRTAQPEDLSPDQQRVFREGTAQPSIEFRYPVNKQGYPWLTLHGFEPNSFQRELVRLENDFDRIHRSEA